MYFKLNGIDYTVESCSVSFDLNASNQKLKMFLSVSARTESDSVPPELQFVKLYHNGGIETGVKTLRSLNGKRFEWKTACNRCGGTLYVLEHEDVTGGIIEVLDITADSIKIRWTGCGNVFWDDEYDKNVPFEAEIETALPELPKYKVLNGMKASKFKIDQNTELEFLNFGELLRECGRCAAMWRNDDLDAWNKFDAVLKMILRHKGQEYPGQAIYKGSAVECGTVFPDDCPVKIKIAKTALDTSNGKYLFYVLCEQ